MKKNYQTILLVCGLLLMLAAFPVFAQEEKSVTENQMSRKPLDNLAELVRRETAAGKVDLTKPFSIELEGVLGSNGRLEAKKTRFIETAGDAAMIEIGKSLIEAANESGFLTHLKSFGVENLKLTLVQNDNQIYAQVVGEVETSQKAATISKSLNTAVRIAETREGKSESLRNEKILISGLQASTNDKTLILKVAYEKSVIHQLINRILN